MKTLVEYSRERMEKYQGTVSYNDMCAFLAKRTGYESGLYNMIQGIADYCNEVNKQNEIKVGDDYYLAPEIESMIRAARALLSSYGQFDGGTLDGYLCDLAEENGLDIN